MSNPTDQPLTMSAEREADIRHQDKIAFLRTDRTDLLTELDATRAAHAETQEQLRVLEDELHRLRDIAIPKFQVHRERLEEQLAEAQKALTEVRRILTESEYYCKHPTERDECGAVYDCPFHAILEAIDAALRAKPEPNALRPAGSEASDAAPFPGGRE